MWVAHLNGDISVYLILFGALHQSVFFFLSYLCISDVSQKFN
jgi:hypothetical protein